MTPNEIDKINRFSERVPAHLADHWNEIVDIITSQTSGNDIEQSDVDERNFMLEVKLRETCKNILIMKQWTFENKINSRTGFNNMIDFILDKLRLNIVNV